MDDKLQRIQRSRPVFLWAAAPRCGTGLVQRLITSSRRILVYGEDGYLTRALPSTLFSLGECATEAEQASTELAGGGAAGWYPSALPEPQRYTDLLAMHFFVVCDHYRKAAERSGFVRWGVKLPHFGTIEFDVLSKLLPESRHIFLYRHIRPVMRSIKARGWVEDAAGFRGFLSQWNMALQEVVRLRFDPTRFLLLRYEDLVAEQAAACRRLCAFLDVASLDRAVFAHKVNTFTGQLDDGHAPDGYIPPSALTSREETMVAELCTPTLRAMGYSGSQGQTAGAAGDGFRTCRAG